MKKPVKAGYLTLTFLCCMWLAQGAAAQNYWSMTTIEINQGMNGTLDDAFGVVKQGMEAADSPAYWLVADAESGTNHYLVAVPHQSWSFMDFNLGAALAAELSPAELEQLGADLQASIKNEYTRRYVERPDLGRAGPEMSTPPDGVILIELEIANGRVDDFEEWMKKLVEASDATAPDAYWGMLQPTFGTDRFIAVVYITNWADMDTPNKSIDQRMLEHFGQRRGQQMLDDSNDIVLSVMQNLYRTRPELARPPE